MVNQNTHERGQSMTCVTVLRTFTVQSQATLLTAVAYLISAQKIVTDKGVRLFCKLQAETENVFVKMPGGLSYLFMDFQIARINNETLFGNLSFYGRSLSGDRIIQIRNAAIPMPTFHEMEAAGAFEL
jgi:hypothetical protein